MFFNYRSFPIFLNKEPSLVGTAMESSLKRCPSDCIWNFRVTMDHYQGYFSITFGYKLINWTIEDGIIVIVPSFSYTLYFGLPLSVVNVGVDMMNSRCLLVVDGIVLRYQWVINLGNMMWSQLIGYLRKSNHRMLG